MSQESPPQLLEEDPGVVAPPGDPGPRARLRALVRPPRTPRQVAITVWAALLVWFVVARGFPLDRGSQLIWILGLLFAVNLGRPWRSQGRILLDWLPFVGFLFVYDYTRGVADTLGRPVHVTDVVHAEEWMFGAPVPTSRLQDWLYDPLQVHWYDVVVSLVYFSHFFVPWVVAVVLYLRSRETWAAWARRLLALSYAGLLTYMLYPAAPPWYAARLGDIPYVSRIATRGWDAIGLHGAGQMIAYGQAGSNQVAAVPSLHAAFAALLLVFLWPRVGVFWRTVLVVYTLAMCFSLVYGGEHYVVDAVLGYVYVAVVAVAVGLWERRRSRRRAAADPGEPVAEPAEPAEPEQAGAPIPS